MIISNIFEDPQITRQGTMPDRSYYIPAAFSFNASHYTQEELTEKAHNFALVPSGATVLCLDYRHNGIGTASCGPALLSQYALTDETVDLSLRLIPEKC